jgi:hypothetical protein
MAVFRRKEEFTFDKYDPEFDTEYGPGQKIEYSGIYRCTNCGREVVVEKGRKTPPHGHHEHDGYEEILWRLVARPD